ncbi:MAG: 3-octaprenyl-4-hydroxybenzoate carboxy-lyase [Gammaproteobacteria bacterium]|nr:3-octaprenyl-4-hydroxybenzoate carboxy-lyase [Gammaproteobacteria bacterium]|tara:strand:+ start:193746 stop:194333 length:588 start_codon:yes stop_codon:yes gene_type:complete
MTENQAQRLIVGISGASGIAYGIETLKQLRTAGIESHLIVSKAAMQTLKQESSMSYAELQDLADVHYSNNDIGAAIASGSFKTAGMIVAPCSIRSMSEIASGFSASLLSRAADVVLKERRRLVLLVRETPLHAGHLQSMLELTRMGGIIMPPVPAFYTKPQSIEDIVAQTVARALDLFAIETDKLQRWEGQGTSV